MMQAWKKQLIPVFIITSILSLILPINSVSSVVTWSEPVRITQNSGVDSFPSILQRINGEILLFWVLGNDIVYMKHNGQSWLGQQLITQDPNVDTDPAVAEFHNGTLIVVWSSNRTGNYDLHYKTLSGSTWSPETRLTTSTASDFSPSAIVARDRTLWLVWHREQVISGTVVRHLYYRLYTSAGWGSEIQLTNLDTWDIIPSIAQMKDGRIWVVWSRWVGNPSNQYDIFHKTYDGASWSAETRLTQEKDWDLHPKIMQDRDGTLLLFWARTLPASATTFQEELFRKSSIDNGATWSVDIQMTFDPSSTITVDDTMPAAAQANDKTVWLIFVSDRLGEADDFDLYLVQSSQILTHDMVPTAILTSPLKLKRGGIVDIKVTVENIGDFAETFQINYFANSIQIGSLTVNLAPGWIQTFSFSWNTSTTNPAKYLISATVAGVVGESIGNLGDNTIKDGTVALLAPGDVNEDGAVDIIDVAIVALAFGTKPGDTKWNPAADLNKDGKVNIIDIAIVAKWYGTKI